MIKSLASLSGFTYGAVTRFWQGARIFVMSPPLPLASPVVLPLADPAILEAYLYLQLQTSCFHSPQPAHHPAEFAPNRFVALVSGTGHETGLVCGVTV